MEGEAWLLRMGVMGRGKEMGARMLKTEKERARREVSLKKSSLEKQVRPNKANGNRNFQVRAFVWRLLL